MPCPGKTADLSLQQDGVVEHRAVVILRVQVGPWVAQQHLHELRVLAIRQGSDLRRGRGEYCIGRAGAVRALGWGEKSQSRRPHSGPGVRGLWWPAKPSLAGAP